MIPSATVTASSSSSGRSAASRIGIRRGERWLTVAGAAQRLRGRRPPLVREYLARARVSPADAAQHRLPSTSGSHAGADSARRAAARMTELAVTVADGIILTSSAQRVGFAMAGIHNAAYPRGKDLAEDSRWPAGSRVRWWSTRGASTRRPAMRSFSHSRPYFRQPRLHAFPGRGRYPRNIAARELESRARVGALGWGAGLA